MDKKQNIKLMKKILSIITILLFAFCLSTSANEFEGKYVNDSLNVGYTITDDSLFIDDIGIEGDCYKIVSISSNGRITLKDDFGDLRDDLTLIKEGNTLIVKDDKDLTQLFTFKKVENY